MGSKIHFDYQFDCGHKLYWGYAIPTNHHTSADSIKQSRFDPQQFDYCPFCYKHVIIVDAVLTYPDLISNPREYGTKISPDLLQQIQTAYRNNRSRIRGGT